MSNAYFIIVLNKRCTTFFFFFFGIYEYDFDFDEKDERRPVAWQNKRNEIRCSFHLHLHVQWWQVFQTECTFFLVNDSFKFSCICHSRLNALRAFFLAPSPIQIKCNLRGFTRKWKENNEIVRLSKWVEKRGEGFFSPSRIHMANYSFVWEYVFIRMYMK